MLLKVRMLQRIYDLSNAAAESRINARLNFRQFLGLELRHRVPDAKCIWHYREQLRKAEVFDAQFDAFVQRIEEAGLLLDQGKIVEATIVKAPVQRNSREENERIKKGKTPRSWSPNKARQKDTHARWTSKHGKHYFGYNNHSKVDRHSKLIDNFVVSAANMHNSQALPDPAEDCDTGQQYLTDSAYGMQDDHAALNELPDQTAGR